MNTKIIKMLVGIGLIAVGSLVLADRLGYVNLELISNQGWAIIFGAISLIFFLSYFLAGVRKWGWLFPALLFAALALILGIFIDHQDNLMIPVSILLSIGIPFYVGYIVNRKHWGLLITAWIMTVISAILIFTQVANSDLIGAIVLYAIGIPFFVVYLANRKHKWALIVGLVLGFIGLFPLIDSILPAESTGPVVMFIFTLFFCLIYIFIKKSWWALIPAGVFFSIGVVALLDTLLPSHDYFMIGNLEFGAYTGVLLLGFSATFWALWLLRGSQPTAWAKYPAIILLILSILSFLMWATNSSLVLALALLVLGVVMIFASIFTRRGAQQLKSR